MPGLPKAVLITGAAGALGVELVRLWLRRGVQVVATRRPPPGPADEGPLGRLAAHAGGRLRLLPLDVAADESLRALAAALLAAPRAPSIDLWINLASVCQRIGLDRLPAPPWDRAVPLGFEVLAALRLGYVLMPCLGERALCACLVALPGAAGEPGSLGLAPRVSPGALVRALRSLAQDLDRRGARLALLHPGPHRPPGQALSWISDQIDDLMAPAGPTPAGEEGGGEVIVKRGS